MVTLIHRLLRSPAFLICLSAGIGGIIPDTDHIPELFGIYYQIPLLWQLNVFFHITDPCDPYGRPLHSAFLIASLFLIGYSLTYLIRHIKVRFLRLSGE